MRTFTEYVAWFQAELVKVPDDPDVSCIGPILRPTSSQGPVPWKLDWALLFQDGNYLRITENYRPLPRTRGFPRGERDHFSFHFGKDPGPRDARGFPRRVLNDPGTILRIDLDRRGPHIHFAGDNHIPQSRVEGMIIESFDLFVFLAAVQNHYKTGKGLDEILGFKVVPQA